MDQEMEAATEVGAMEGGTAARTVAARKVVGMMEAARMEAVTMEAVTMEVGKAARRVAESMGVALILELEPEPVLPAAP